MKALLLAAGRGTRVMPLTNDIPKPMIPIINKPVMEFLVEHLRRFDVKHIMVNTSYKSNHIEDYFRDGERFGVEMGYSFEGHIANGECFEQPLGSAGAIQNIHQHAQFFDDTFVVLCGDAIIDIDLDELLNYHRNMGGLATIALRKVPYSDVSNYGVVVRDGYGRITEFQEKPTREQAKSNLINTGVYIFEPGVLDYIPKDRPFDIGSELFPLLAEQQQLFGIQSKEDWQWLDIGRIADFHDVTMKALSGQIKGFNMPGKEIRPGLWTGINVDIHPSRCHIEGPVYIGSSCQIDPGVTLIGPVCIGAGSVIKSGSHIERSVVMPHTTVTSDIYCANKIIGSEYCILDDGTILDAQHTDIDWLFHDSRKLKEELCTNPV